MENNTYSLIEENNEIKKGKLEQLLKNRWKKICFLSSITRRQVTWGGIQRIAEHIKLSHSSLLPFVFHRLSWNLELFFSQMPFVVVVVVVLPRTRWNKVQSARLSLPGNHTQPSGRGSSPDQLLESQPEPCCNSLHLEGLTTPDTIKEHVKRQQGKGGSAQCYRWNQVTGKAKLKETSTFWGCGEKKNTLISTAEPGCGQWKSHRGVRGEEDGGEGQRGFAGLYSRGWRRRRRSREPHGWPRAAGSPAAARTAAGTAGLFLPAGSEKRQGEKCRWEPRLSMG